MGWLTLSELDGRVFYDVIDEIKSGSPRATAVVAGAFVEDHLTRVIKWRLVQEPVNKNKNVAEDMFRPGGSVGDFSNKIDMAYLTGCISKEAWKELETIRRIRNDFAHKMKILDFDITSIADRCANLKLWEEIKVKLRAADDKKSGK
jgi:DNA-binding MltR family transcriptional regulator